MSKKENINNARQVLERLAREGSQRASEISVVAAPGGGTIAWVIKVKSHYSYNVYNVRAVVLGESGLEPDEIGSEVQAFNVAESFIQQGQLAAGTYAVMVKLGEKNAFYAPV
jgi:hypothetical protein